MRYFGLVDFQRIVLALFFGLLALLFAAVAWGGYARREGGSSEAAQGEAVPEAETNPVPPILIFVYAAVAVSALGYAAVQWWSGAPVGY